MKRREFVKAVGAFGLTGLHADARVLSQAHIHPAASGQMPSRQEIPLSKEDIETNNQIRREKFDLVLPEVMKKNGVDMWIHVMRETIPDPFGAEDLGSSSGVFVFTDRGGNRIERAVMERRWGDSFASATWRVTWDTKTVETCGAYDIVEPAILVKEPSGPNQRMEYDLRFKGLRKFVEERDPKRIAINFKLKLGPYETTTKSLLAFDGLSHTDYLLLTQELGPKYTERLESSESVMMDYTIRRTKAEMEQLKLIRSREDEAVRKSFGAIVPGVTRNREVGSRGTYGLEGGVTVFRREAPGKEAALQATKTWSSREAISSPRPVREPMRMFCAKVRLSRRRRSKSIGSCIGRLMKS
jgi:hypothetical protein